MIRRLCFLIAVAAAAGTSVAAAATPVVPVFAQHRIAATAPALAYVPARLAIGWRYERGGKVWWAHTSTEQQAWRCVNGRKLVAATALPPDRFADVGLGRIAASGHRL